jgi:hypothetical protein
MIFFANGRYDLIPTERIKSKEVGYSIEWSCDSFFEIDEFERLEVELAEGEGLETSRRRELGLEWRRIGNNSRR